MFQKLKVFLLILTPFTLVFFGVQHTIVENLKDNQTVFLYNTHSIYLFHFIATLLIYLVVLFVQKTLPEKTGFAFMVTSLLKIMVAIVFLFPLITNKEQVVLNDVLAFFIPYFLFLLLETIFCVKNLNSN